MGNPRSKDQRNNGHKKRPDMHSRQEEQRPKSKKNRGILIGMIAIIGCLVIIIIALLLDRQIGVGGQLGDQSWADPGANSGLPAITQKTSTDRNIAYVKNYVGQNLASACDWSRKNICLFSLTAGDKSVNLMINIISPDGRNIQSDDIAKAYKIVSQSLPQNTELEVLWDGDTRWTLNPEEMDVTVEPVGAISEETKTGEVERYQCASKGNYTGRVVRFIRKNSSSDLQRSSYDIVECEWTEFVVN